MDIFVGRVLTASCARNAVNLFVPVLLICASSGAQAGLTESAAITKNHISYSFDGTNFTEVDVPGNYAAIYDNQVSGKVSQIGVDVKAFAGGGAFDFLQNVYCIGKCSVGLTTEIQFSVTNTGLDTADYRFDSLITPGHLGRYDVGTLSAGGGFMFDIYQKAPGDSGDGTRLYQGRNIFQLTPTGESQLGPAFIIDDPASIGPGGTLNGFDYQQSGLGWQTVDWSATNVHLALDTIGPGETHHIILRSFATAVAGTGSTSGDCTVLETCQGLQVTFGDPRTKGGSTLTAGRSLISALGPLIPNEPVIGREFDAYRSYGHVVPKGAPLPPEPPLEPAYGYAQTYSQPLLGPVPEPGSWAMMIAGLAFVGACLRRAKPARAHA